jgi:hypothetical protein
MSTYLININDTTFWWPKEPIYIINEYVAFPTVHNVIDPKLERSYNLARAKNNKSEMRRLEKLIVNNKQRRY